MNCAGGKNNLPAGFYDPCLTPLLKSHSNRSAVFNDQFMNHRSGFNDEIFALLADRIDIGAFGTEPATIFLGRLKIRKPCLCGGVVIMIGRVAKLTAGFNNIIQQLITLCRQGHIDGPVTTVKVVTAWLKALGFFEIRQYLVKRPATAAKLRPGVKVTGLAANVEHAVNGARATQDLAAWHRDRAIAAAFLRRCGEHPVHGRVGHGFDVTNGHVNPRVTIFPASFQ